MIMQLLRGLFGKKEEPRRVRSYNRNHKTLKNKANNQECLYKEIGRYKYFNDMDIARKYIRSHYNLNEISFAVRDLNKKGFKTVTGKDYTPQNLRWYLLNDLDYEIYKMIRNETKPKKVKK